MTARASRSRSISTARRSVASPFATDIDPGIFRREISRARTFGFMKDVERLWAAGYALGSSLENSVVIGDDHRVINMEGLRYRTSSCATRCSIRWATLRWPGPASSAASGPSAAGTSSMRRRCGACFRIVGIRDRRDDAARARPHGRDDRRQRARLRALDALIALLRLCATEVGALPSRMPQNRAIAGR
jgi:hypothetical protein